MKKFVKALGAVALTAALVACGSNDNENNASGDGAEDDTQTIRIGTSAVPHASILEAAEPLLAEKGIELDIVVFSDYILPNQELESGDLDVNYFQTPGYLAQQIADYDYDFVSVGSVHAEPIGIYSQDYASLDELPDGAQIILSDSISDHGRILPIFEDAGLIELGNAEGELATIDDITSNPKNLEFGSRQIEARLLAASFESGEGDAVAINTNYALEGNIDIDESGIAFEADDKLQGNLIVVRAEDENNDAILTLLEVLQSEEIQEFIKEEFKGAVIPLVE